MTMVITLTLNPAFDVYYTLERLLPGKEQRAEKTGRFIGGKGINTSRALSAFGVSNRAAVLIGRDGAQEFIGLAEKEGLNLIDVSAEGAVRENITLRTESGEETRISTDTALTDEEALESIFKKIKAAVSDGGILVFSGSLPLGADKSKVTDFLSGLSNVKIALDSKSITEADIKKLRPWLIKPNEEEALAFGDTYKTAAAYLKELGCENVMISLGEKGVFFSGSEEFFIRAPKICARSTVGAGDSITAGFICAYLLNESERNCVRFAVAAGSAACEKEGTAPPDRDEVYRLLSENTF